MAGRDGRGGPMAGVVSGRGGLTRGARAVRRIPVFRHTTPSRRPGLRPVRNAAERL